MWWPWSILLIRHHHLLLDDFAFSAQICFLIVQENISGYQGGTCQWFDPYYKWLMPLWTSTNGAHWLRLTNAYHRVSSENWKGPPNPPPPELEYVTKLSRVTSHRWLHHWMATETHPAYYASANIARPRATVFFQQILSICNSPRYRRTCTTVRICWNSHFTCKKTTRTQLYVEKQRTLTEETLASISPTKLDKTVTHKVCRRYKILRHGKERVEPSAESLTKTR